MEKYHDHSQYSGIRRRADRVSADASAVLYCQDTVRSFKAILDGEADDLPEVAFLYVGTIEEARKKAESLK